MKIKVLTGNNWMQWFEQLTFLFTYKGYDMLFDEEWVKTNKLNSDHKIKNAFAISTLYNTVHEDLQPLLYDQRDFGQAIQALRMASGQTSVISLCDIANTDGLVNITEGEAAGFLLRSLKQDISLSSLVQNLYDIKPFAIKKFIKRLIAEHGQQMKAPTRNNTDDIDKRFKQIKSNIQLLLKLHNKHSTNQVEEDSQSSVSDNDSDGPNGFLIVENNDYLNVVSNYKQTNRPVLDSGASTSTVCNYHLLIDPKMVKMSLRTFAGRTNVTHMGKLKLGNVIVYPVLFAPDGGTNSISVSQLEDHGICLIHKNQKLLLKSNNSIVMEFPRNGKLYVNHASLKLTPEVNHINGHVNKDWHIALSHPSDEYLKKFLKVMNVPFKEKINFSSRCEICRKCKMKRSPHKNPIPAAKHPFHKIHFDLMEIKPMAKNSNQYVLVLIDDFLPFNRVVMLQNKSQAETSIMNFIREIKNKLGFYPSYLHSNKGPQSNGVAERFNQTLMIKIRFLLAQCSLPIHFWDEAAHSASTIINMLPSKTLRWKNTNEVLRTQDMCLEPVQNHNSLIPFGLKVFVHRHKESKISPPADPLLFIGFENYLDAMQLFDTITRRIVISRDYSPTMLKLNYDHTAVLRKDMESLPVTAVTVSNKISEFTDIEPLFRRLKDTSVKIGLPQEPFHHPSNSTPHDPPIIVASESVTEPKVIHSVKKGYSYVPHYDKAPKNVNANVNTSNIIPELSG
ncbi:hypothetical protein O181_101887 [Austropuccinia psidii MF-1]|uniref:Integrase catalytic domain-containing protein n=1 Tax=Austropuccinia psidii MF-1 TaxID=1389203 RepID=A0A9Q3JI50_9BASI|nr:hypothetical protein [Austropuccinia psidii MF-1]